MVKKGVEVMRKSELIELYEDAMRYRYLKSTQNMDCRDCMEGDMEMVGSIWSIYVVVDKGCSEAPYSYELDDAIDQAIINYPNPDVVAEEQILIDIQQQVHDITISFASEEAAYEH